jgi:hypothetical protein
MKMKHAYLVALSAILTSFAFGQDAPQREGRPAGPGGPGGPGGQRPVPAEVLKEFDKDGDGKLSDDERKAMREAMQARAEERRQEMIKKYDKDGDGKLSEEERKTMMEEQRAAMEARRAEMMKKYDKDGDGKLNEEERAAMLKDNPQGMPGMRRPGGQGGREGGAREGGARPNREGGAREGGARPNREGGAREGRPARGNRPAGGDAPAPPPRLPQNNTSGPPHQPRLPLAGRRGDSAQTTDYPEHAAPGNSVLWHFPLAKTRRPSATFPPPGPTPESRG